MASEGLWVVATLPSGLSEHVEDDEDLARYLTSSSQFNAVMVKPAALLPKDGKPSVFRPGSEPREVLWQIARDHALGDRTLHGAAIFKARHVRAVSLDVLSSEPPPRHANLVGWASSASDPDLAKAERKEQALLIVQHAMLVQP